MPHRYSQNYFMNCHGEMMHSIDWQFMRWVDDIENIVLEKTHFNLLDLPDEDYMYNFENHVTANVMAQKIIDSFENYASIVKNLFI